MIEHLGLILLRFSSEFNGLAARVGGRREGIFISCDFHRKIVRDNLTRS